MVSTDFSKLFFHLAGVEPFPWQRALYELFVRGEIPKVANIPTGLGKTSIVAIWLIALATHPDRVSRRLVYVVNRRTVVDQTTEEVVRLRKELIKPALAEVRQSLASLCALPLPTLDAPPLAISTLRGQFADNGEWCADPSRPAIIVGTVDMIGSGLLFSRYTRGFKTRPLHAGFLAQDALVVHDEAHLEPAFQTLLDAIVTEQRRNADFRGLRVIELTATSRSAHLESDVKPFRLDEDPNDKDTDNDTVKKRLNAVKRLALVSVTRVDGGKDKSNDGSVRDKILELALAKRDSYRAVLIFARSVEAVGKIVSGLEKAKQAVAALTGTMRGRERDELVSRNAVFQRFLPDSSRAADVEAATGTVYLVATSAGEVGVNLSADDLVCDLSTYESMAQRFGRVNRFGERSDSEISVVYRENLQTGYDEGLEKAKAAKKDADKKVAAYQQKNLSILRFIRTLDVLRKLHGNASPAALDLLPVDDRVAAFSPLPTLRFATDVQFDAWASTSIRKYISARPPIAPYLHGVAEWQPAETYLAWREELDVITTPQLRAAYPPAELLEDFPLKPHELLRDSTDRIIDQLINIVSERMKGNASLPDAWLVGADGEVELFPLTQLFSDQEADDDMEEAGEEVESASASDDKKVEEAQRKRAVSRLGDATLILPASLGGIDKNGMLSPGASGAAAGETDVADIVSDDAVCKRKREWTLSPEVPAGFRLVRTIDKLVAVEGGDDTASSRYWVWLETRNVASEERRFTQNNQPETLASHTASVEANATAIAKKLLPPDLAKLLTIAARLHDLGKNRASWQRNIGNVKYDPGKQETILAKSSPGMNARTVAEHYRHEFGSLSDVTNSADFTSLNDVERDIVLHLVAAHHGRARPHFPEAEIFDSSDKVTRESILTLATDVPRRFARLQCRFGRWGLAWLESLLRAADYAASAGIVAQGSPETSPFPRQTPATQVRPETNPTITLDVNPTNPGHYFACCGLLELAARLSPNSVGWFQQLIATGGWRFHLANTTTIADLLEKVVKAEINALDPDDATASALMVEAPFNVRLDWWKTADRNTAALKVWAGTMEGPRIARAMQAAVKGGCFAADFDHERLLFDSRIAYDPANLANKVEPFYFDSNRGPNAHSRDVGFAANDLKLETLASPAVELLTLVGLQRAIPAPVPNIQRNFDYHVWTHPLPVSLVSGAINGVLPDSHSHGFRFESWFRTGQRKHKAFLNARAISNK
ncbi:type I-U CRISPR-associated helicase/endonuclease Cas3 [Verrucomicrobium sp. BvORR106]|uniref:type I-G CRISPR-associated helicase/endonuclease Cas3g n=1 Tax=Verrucomicrobium sp. BvORR106 TaxID=1403819 RepID=UPI000571CFAB|nr:type I-U CRISPR-associated helicase/endonuclease Cas3 [Verrucomicrobium sp. BvORR106]